MINFRILTGILFGPEALDFEKEPITSAFSSGDVGVKSRDFMFGFFKNEEKWLKESAIVVKKSLKPLATVSGSEVTESPVVIEIEHSEFA